jgi:D-sedoheptulose 7-phosphate isomerase
MRDNIRSSLLESAAVKQRLVETRMEQIEAVATMLVDAYRGGHKTLVFGNGGSAADAQHFASEMTGRFMRERKALPSLALNVNVSTVTCIANDYGYDAVFERQVEAFVLPGDVVIGITTSGNSPNVLRAMRRARDMGAKTIGLTGRDGGGMPAVSDLCLVVPSDSTPRIQESHIALIHIWCDLVETALFGDQATS